MSLNGVLASSALVEVIRNDPEVSKQMRDLAIEAINEAQMLLRNGPPNIRVQVLKAIMPSVAAAMKASTVDDDREQFKEEMRQMVRDMRDDGDSEVED